MARANCQTARRFAPPLDLRHRWIADPKVDGVRALIVPGEDGLRAYSRQGRRIDAAQAAILPALERTIPDGFVLDGELWTGSFAGTIGLINTARPTDRALASLQYMAFDLLDAAAYERGRFTAPQRTRKEALDTLGDALGDAPIHVVPWVEVADAAHLERVYRIFCERGFEGVMLKRADRPYARRRTDAWLKLKPLESDEFPVTGFREGTGGLEGSLGAVTFSLPGGREGAVGTGLSDAQRRGIWEQRAEILEAGLWVTVAYQTRTTGSAAESDPDAEAGLSFPRFVGFRTERGGSEVPVPEAGRPRPAPDE